MTTVLAVQGDGWAIVGFDSLVSDDNGRTFILAQGSSKVAKNGPYLLGAAGDLRAINILAHAFTPPKPGNLVGSRLDRFITSKFVPELRSCFEDHGYAAREAKERATYGGVIIAVINGVIYEIDEDYSWIRDASGIYAAGTGGDFAMGALHAMIESTETSQLQIDKAKRMVKEAISIAIRLDASSGGAVHLVHQVSPT